MSVRRRDDPETFEGQPFRNEEPVLKIGYRQASLSIKGATVFLALAVLAIVGSQFYAGFMIQQTIIAENRKVADQLTSINGRHTAEHAAIIHTGDRTSCVITMDAAARARFRDRYQAGAFKQMCPWVNE